MEGLEVLKEYAALIDRKKEVEAQLTAVKGEIAALDEAALNVFQDEGVSSIKVDGRTLYLRREVRAAKITPDTDAEACMKALHEAGMDDYVPERVNWQGLSAFFRDNERETGDPVPDSLKGAFRVQETFKVGSRSS